MTTATIAPALLDITLSTLETFLRTVNDPAWLVALRRRAFENYLRLPWPAEKDEKWKRSGLDEMPWSAFTFPTGYDDGAKNAVIPPTAKGTTWTPLSTAVLSQADTLKAKWTSALERAHNDKFFSLALAFANAGGVLRVARASDGMDPIVFSTRGAGQAIFPLVFIIIEAGAVVGVWDDTPEQSVAHERFICNHTSLELGRDAQLSMYSLEHADAKTWHFQFQDVEQNEASRLNAVAVSVGGRVFHNETTLRLQGKGAENKLLGVLFGEGEQVFENWVMQLHTAPSTTSNIQYRGALKGFSKSFFSGLVSISKEGQQSDAFQSSKSLLLSKDARADAIPNLEILADDVKCSHGAAVGPVDEDQKFYLRTRGIPTEQAEELIVQGFFEPVIAEITIESERDRLRAFIEEKLK